MPFPNPNPIPDTQAIRFHTYSMGAQAIPFDWKFVPKNQDGTIFDCSAAQKARLYYDNGGTPGGWPGSYTEISIRTADSTGVTIAFDSTTLVQIAGCGSNRGKIRLTITDNGNIEVPASLGTWSNDANP